MRLDQTGMVEAQHLALQSHHLQLPVIVTLAYGSLTMTTCCFALLKPHFWLYLHIDEGRVPNVRMAFLLCRTLENRELHILVDKRCC